MEYTLLVVEDDEKIRAIICDYFSSKGFQTASASNGVEALEVFQSHCFDILLLDVMMPKMDGYTLCRQIRKSSDVPIIFLTAKSDEEDQLYGYNLLADDYITKPFSLPLLYAKVLALVKRSQNRLLREQIISGDICIDVKAQQVWADKKKVVLPPKQYQILLYLIRHKEQVLSRDQILNAVWGNDFFGADRVVDTHIKKLRAALGAQAIHIQTVIKVGYKFVEDGQ